MSAEFSTKATVFCRCGYLMTDYQKGFVTCINPRCIEYGKDYEVKVTLTERSVVKA